MRAVIVYNPSAMRGKIGKKIPYIQQRLRTKFDDCDAVETLQDGLTADLVQSLCDDHDIIVAVGGDGTVHYVANGIAKSGKNVAMGVIPLGTINDVAHNLRVPKNLDKAIDIILRGYTLNYDLISDGKDYIVYTIAGGIFVSSSFSTPRKLKSVFGRLAYGFVGMRGLFTHKSLPLSVIDGDKKYSGKYMLCLVLNSYSTAGKMINGESSLSDGKMEIVLIRRAKRGFFGFWRAFNLVTRLFLFGLKSVKNSKDVDILYTSSVKLENHADVDFTVDGEKCEFLNKTLTINKQIPMFHGVNF